jgi:hypothetical protein
MPLILLRCSRNKLDKRKTQGETGVVTMVLDGASWTPCSLLRYFYKQKGANPAMLARTTIGTTGSIDIKIV